MFTVYTMFTMLHRITFSISGAVLILTNLQTGSLHLDDRTGEGRVEPARVGVAVEVDGHTGWRQQTRLEAGHHIRDGRL